MQEESGSMMKKRLLALLLAGVLTVGMVSDVALAEEEQVVARGSVAVQNGKETDGAAVSAKAAASGRCGNNLTWSLDGDTLTISGQGAMYDYNKYDNFVPWYGRRFSSVVVEEGVTYIGYNAFSGVSDLQRVSLPSTLTTIGNYAFYDDINLKEVEMTDGVKVIGKNAFYSCSSLTEIEFPSGLESICEFAFFDCSGLTSISIPEGVTEIGESAFSKCSKISQISIPSSVTTIGVRAFDAIPLASVSYNGTAAQWCDIEVYGADDILKNNINFQGDPTMPETIADTSGDITWVGRLSTGELTISGTGSVEISSPSTTWLSKSHVFTPTSVVIQSGVTGIGADVFTSHTDMTDISLPDTLETIGDNAFMSCSKLSGISIPDSVTSIGTFAFSDCTAFTSVSWPATLTTMPRGVFSGCTALTSVTIPAGVTSISMMAFSRCDSLEDVNYTGTQGQWNSIGIGILNSALTEATIHYNYVPGSMVGGTIANELTDVTVELYDQNEKLVGSVTGNESYVFEGVLMGTYTLKVSKANYVTREYLITVGDGVVEQDIAISQLGDVNVDGEVNVQDLNGMFAHANGGTLILDAYALDCADVSPDGVVDVMDLNRLYTHLSGDNRLW